MANPAATGAPFVLVVGLDLADSESGAYALDQTSRMAIRIPGSQMHVVHVVSPTTTAEELHDAAGLLRMYVSEKATALGGLGQQSVGVHVRSGEAGREIAQLAIDLCADVVVVGTDKPLQLKKLLVGSTAERVMSHVSCPVLVAGPKPSPAPAQSVAIEPPCPDCVEMRSATKARTWWCARHSELHHSMQHHIYSYTTELPFGEPDPEVASTAVDS